MGDALAVTLMKLRAFKETDFAQFHPGGSLGRRLLTTVEDVMRKEELPLITPTESIKSLINIMSGSRLGLAIVVEEEQLLGIVTDGDIRRAMEEQEAAFFSLKVSELMTQNPKVIRREAKLTEAQNLMTKAKVNSLLVVEEKELLGVVQIYDLGI
jgi:arabinose-5-phosphate isomerase